MVRPAMLPDGTGGNGRVSPPGIGFGRRSWLMVEASFHPIRSQYTTGIGPHTPLTRVKPALSRANDAAESDMARRGLLGVALAGGGSVTQTVVRGAQVRSALDDAARIRFARIVFGLVDTGIRRDAARRRRRDVLTARSMVRGEVVGGP